MSASREKKQRQDDSGQGLTQKQIKERREAAAKKRNQIIYTVVGVVLAVLVIALLVWNSGFFQKRAVAATVGDQEFTVVDVSYYYYQAINSEYRLYQQYASMGLSAPFDLSKPLSKQYTNSDNTKNYQQYFQEAALNDLKDVAALCAEAKKANYTLSAEGEQQVQDVLAQIDEICARSNITRSVYLKESYGKYMTEDVFLKNLRNSVLATEFESNHADSLTYTDEQIQDYYKEHANDLDSYDYRYFFVSGRAADPTDADGNPMKDEEGNTIQATDEEKAAAMAEAKTKADQALAEIMAAGGSESAFAAVAPNYVAEASKEEYAGNPDATLESHVVGSSFSSQIYSDWLTDSSRAPGDLTSIESENSGYYVLMFLGRALDESPTANIRHILIKADAPEDDMTTPDKDESTDPPSQEAMDAAKTKAQSLLDQFNAGDKSAESFGKLAEENSADTSSAVNGGLIEHVYQGQTFDAFNNWVMDPARQSGDTTLVENPQTNQQGWHVIYFQDWSDPVWKITADSAMRNTDQNAWKNELMKPYTASPASGMSQVGN